MMSLEYRSYLAAAILNEERVITYRLLSRALKVHVNTAKQMLFEFHRQQNGKKPGTVHATYLVAGTKRKLTPAITNGNGAPVKDGEDEYMQSSPFRSSPAPNPEEYSEDFQVLSLTLVREENLDGALTKSLIMAISADTSLEVQSMYQIITSIYIYSLAPYLLKDLQILSDSARETAEAQVNQDPFQVIGTYGTITNKGARRRTGLRAPPSAVQVHAEAAHHLSQPGDIKKGTGAPAPKTRVEPRTSQSSRDILRKSSQEKRNVSPNPPHLKRDSSNIFQSFAKAKPPLKREITDSSAGASGLESSLTSDLEDEAMKDTSEGEEDDYIPPPNMNSEGTADPDRNSRKSREAALKKMMEDDDDENEDANVGLQQQQLGNAKGSPASEPAEPPDEAVQVSGGRRRGRRRVMKKKTVKDDEGYLVTREEAAWESFSEEEPLKSKAKPSSSVPSSSDKSKKGSAKAGQGSIMSFFGKK